jgi:prophage regulatory protein
MLVPGQGQDAIVTKRLDLVGVTEVREMLGVSRQRVHQIIRDDPTFPPPVAELAAGNVWMRPDIVAWAKRRGRLKRGRDIS